MNKIKTCGKICSQNAEELKRVENWDRSTALEEARGKPRVSGSNSIINSGN